MFFDASLYNLGDVLEGSGILVHHVVAQCYAVAGVCLIANYLEDSVEM